MLEISIQRYWPLRNILCAELTFQPGFDRQIIGRPVRRGRQGRIPEKCRADLFQIRQRHRCLCLHPVAMRHIHDGRDQNMERLTIQPEILHRQNIGRGLAELQGQMTVLADQVQSLRLTTRDGNRACALERQVIMIRHRHCKIRRQCSVSAQVRAAHSSKRVQVRQCQRDVTGCCWLEHRVCGHLDQRVTDGRHNRHSRRERMRRHIQRQRGRCQQCGLRSGHTQTRQGGLKMSNRIFRLGRFGPVKCRVQMPDGSAPRGQSVNVQKTLPCGGLQRPMQIGIQGNRIPANSRLQGHGRRIGLDVQRCHIGVEIDLTG